MTPEELTKLKRAAAALPPLLRIGKNALSPGVLAEVKRQLENRGLVKLKLLKAVTETQDRRAFAESLAQQTESTLVHAVGGIVILAKKPGRESRVHANHSGPRFRS